MNNLSHSDIIALIDRIRVDKDITAYNELVEWYNEKKDTMLPSVAQDLARAIQHGKKLVSQ